MYPCYTLVRYNVKQTKVKFFVVHIAVGVYPFRNESLTNTVSVSFHICEIIQTDENILIYAITITIVIKVLLQIIIDISNC